MIGKRTQDAISEQIKHELESAYLYLAMVAYFEAEGLEGMAQWMTVQAQEEVAHAMKFFHHINERDGRVELLALTQPQKEWSSPLEAFKAAYKHEQFITGKIDELVKIDEEENDNAAKIMLQWFVTEQVEEESSTHKVVELLERIGDSGHGLMMVDRELGTRIAAPSATEE
ncbi:ferritin [Candidatus Bipolaricaulota bacterium]|nr:ferritin [Candidatus Bipolaricaulota bacterium]